MTLAKREFLMLLHTYKDQDISGWYWSEKFNGMCAFWDGGLTTGLPCSKIPFANTKKHARYKVPPIATGLWSRYGQPIQCPKIWREKLPPFPLHGELAIPGLTIQDVSKVVKKLNPNPFAWMSVKLKVFDAPDYASFSTIGRIYNNIWEKEFTQEIQSWIMERMVNKNISPFRAIPLQFGAIYVALKDTDIWNKNVELIKQHKLPEHIVEAPKEAEKAMWSVVDKGGEGLVLRNPHSYWEAKRSHDILKMKPNTDGQAVVRGLIYGEATDKGSRLLGVMGALIVEWKGKVFKLGSGFSDEERELMSLINTDPTIEAVSCPGEEASIAVEAAHFLRGSKIKFRYRELTNAGIPAEARHVK